MSLFKFAAKITGKVFAKETINDWKEQAQSWVEGIPSTSSAPVTIPTVTTLPLAEISPNPVSITPFIFLMR